LRDQRAQCEDDEAHLPADRALLLGTPDPPRMGVSPQLDCTSDWTAVTLEVNDRGDKLDLEFGRRTRLDWAEVFGNGQAEIVDFNAGTSRPDSYSRLGLRDGRRVRYARLLARAERPEAGILLRLQKYARRTGRRQRRSDTSGGPGGSTVRAFGCQSSSVRFRDSPGLSAAPPLSGGCEPARPWNGCRIQGARRKPPPVRRFRDRPCALWIAGRPKGRVSDVRSSAVIE
jgi:hypothetical protein